MLPWPGPSLCAATRPPCASTIALTIASPSPLLQFIVEALAISIVGGLIGLALGAAMPLAVTLLGVLDAPVMLSAVAVSLSFSLAVGLFFGIRPARRTAKINPIDALRHE